MSLAAMAAPWGRAAVAAPTAGARPATSPRSGSLATILAAVNAEGARAVLVNVWATWCEPCREELPDLLRFYREHQKDGLRLVMVSADDEEQKEEVARALTEAARTAGFTGAFDAPGFIKREDDTVFVNGLDPRWSGALPATFLFDGFGKRRHSWLRPITYQDLEKQSAALLTAPPANTKTMPNPMPKTMPDPKVKPRRNP